MTDTFKHSDKHIELIKKTKALRLIHLEAEAQTFSMYMAQDCFFTIFQEKLTGKEKLFLGVTPEEMLSMVKLPEEESQAQFEKLAI